MSDDAKHTPAPWRAIENPSKKGDVSHFIVEGDVPEDEAVHLLRVVYLNESDANARLVAAAPELLAACEKVKALWAFEADHAQWEFDQDMGLAAEHEDLDEDAAHAVVTALAKTGT